MNIGFGFEDQYTKWRKGVTYKAVSITIVKLQMQRMQKDGGEKILDGKYAPKFRGNRQG